MVLVLAARLAVCFLLPRNADEPSGARAGLMWYHLLLKLIFFAQLTDHGILDLLSASNPTYIQTADFLPLDFEMWPSLSLEPVSLLNSAPAEPAITAIFITKFTWSGLLRMLIINFVI